MRVSVYSYCWDAVRFGFDYRNALDNWVRVADEIVISVNTSTDGTYEAIESYAKERGYPVKLIATYYDPVVDPFYYGKVVDAALQACTGDLMIAQDMDERLSAKRPQLEVLARLLAANPRLDAIYIPTVDLYGAYDKYLPPGDGTVCKGKWYLTRKGLHRGPVSWGIKPDGRPNYEKTSCDEPLREDGQLATSHVLFRGTTLEQLRQYAEEGWPVVFHLGYVDFNERLTRSLWWKSFWERASGDPNKHPTSVEEIANRETKPHGLSLWEPQPRVDVRVTELPPDFRSLRGFREHVVGIDDALLPPQP